MSDFTSPLDAALRYADRGWPVFPCRPSKKPFTEHGFKDATVDHAQIVAWWRKWPEAQIGVACGAAGLCVVDLDMGSGKDGIAAFSRLEEEHGPHWCGLIACTPRGGRHLIYLMPDEPVANGVDIVEKKSGIDVRADGGYIVVPSPSSPGRNWLVGDPFDVEDDGDTGLGQMPEWVERIVRGGRKVSKSSPAGSAREAILPHVQVDAIRSALKHIDSDPRDVWIRVGMALKSTGAGGAAYDLWCEWSRTSPKFDEQVQSKQWRSLREFFIDGHEVTLGTLFHLAREAGYEPSLEEQVAVEAAPMPDVEPRKVQAKRPFPLELMNCPGLVGEVAAWMVSSSTRRQPAMCLASSLVTLGAILGRKVATPTDLRTNIYCLGIGETACGKDPGVRLPHLLLTRAKLGSLVGPGEWKSDSGLRAALIDAPSHAAYVDEFTKLLDAMSGRQVPAHLKGIKRYLLELWAASNGVHLSPAYANRQLHKPVEIEQPNLCVYGTGVPSELFSSLDRGAVSDGFLNRLLIFFADDQMPQRQKVGRAEPPAELVERVVALAAAVDNGKLATLPGARPNARMVPMDPDAEQMLAAIDLENDARIVSLREHGDPLADLWVRMGAHVAKLALIRTVSDVFDRTITSEDVAWARDLVVWCLERTMAEAESRVADSQQEALTKRVLRIVVDAGPAGLTSSQLTRKTQWLRRSDRKDILTTLVEGGDVVAKTEDLTREGRGAVQVTSYVASQFLAVAEAG